MRASYRAHRAAWDALFARPDVTLLCFCHDPTHCHRGVLATLLTRCGAVYEGAVTDLCGCVEAPSGHEQRDDDDLLRQRRRSGY